MNSEFKIREFQWGDWSEFLRFYNMANANEDSFESDQSSKHDLLLSPNRDISKHCFLAIENSDDLSILAYMILDPEPPIARCIASIKTASIELGSKLHQEFIKVAITYAHKNAFTVLHTRTNATDSNLHEMMQQLQMSHVRTEWTMTLDFKTPTLEQHVGTNYSIDSFRIGNDEEILATLQNLCFGQHWGFSPNTRPQIEARMQTSNSPPEGVKILRLNNFPIGYVWTEQEPTSEGILGKIGMVGVHPKMRGHGLGNYLTKEGIKFLKQSGAISINLDVDSENSSAWKIYKSLGFSKIDEHHWYEKKLSPLDGGNS